MLIVESHSYSERGNWNEAAQSSLDVLRLGHDTSRGGVTFDFTAGALINAIGRRELWTILPHLNAPEAKLSARQLEKIIQTQTPLADILREEKSYGQAGLLEIMRTRGWRSVVSTYAENFTELKDTFEIATTSCRVFLNNFSAHMDSLIVDSEKPYAYSGISATTPNDVHIKTITPDYQLTRWNFARDEASNDLFLVALALRAYRLENNSYPENLKQLTPKYIAKIPADPFGAGESLRYKTAGAEYSLYSIGPDGIDNGGRVIEDKRNEKSSRNIVSPESKGDFVAGINH